MKSCERIGVGRARRDFDDRQTDRNEKRNNFHYFDIVFPFTISENKKETINSFLTSKSLKTMSKAFQKLVLGCGLMSLAHAAYSAAQRKCKLSFI